MANYKPNVNFYRRILPDICIDFSSYKGQQVFKDALDAGYMNAYFKLGAQLRTQDEPGYCGLTSLVMVLNALAVDPGKIWKGVWRWYHEDMLECCTSLDEIKVNGISMQQLSCVAKCNQLDSKVVYAEENLTVDLLREEIKTACRSAEMALVISFGRKVLKQTGVGHFAPVGGYSPKEDLVLLLEPARFKYPPYWVTVSKLLEAMQSVDPVTNRSRGYLSFTKSTSQPTVLFRLSRALNFWRPISESFVCFIHEALSFLKQKVSDETPINVIVAQTADKFYELSLYYKECGKSLFFTTMQPSVVDVFSPEHQDAILMLIQGIEMTEVYRLIQENFEDKAACPDNEKGCGMRKIVCKIHCGASTCLLCFPHFLTLLFCMFSLFMPSSINSDHSLMALSEDDYSSSYLERLVALADDLIKEKREELKQCENSSDLPEDNDEDALKRYKTSKLFLNEIDQLQIQMRHFLNASSRRNCCGL